MEILADIQVVTPVEILAVIRAEIQVEIPAVIPVETRVEIPAVTRWIPWRTSRWNSMARRT